MLEDQNSNKQTSPRILRNPQKGLDHSAQALVEVVSTFKYVAKTFDMKAQWVDKFGASPVLSPLLKMER
jgi:hypothetical protein